jgi:HK97 family phage major capsid protein
MTSVEMLQKRKALYDQLLDLDKRGDENGKLSSDDQAQWERINAEIDDYGKAIERKKEMEAKEALFAERKAQKEEVEGKKEDRNYEDVMRHYLKRGEARMNDQDFKILQEKRGTNTQITTTDSLGGYLVPETWANSIREEMVWYAPVLEVANVFTTATGGTWNEPTNDDTANMADVISQGTADTVKDLTFGNQTMSDYTYSSGLIKASWEQMNDSAYNLQAFIGGVIAKRFGRRWETDLTNGDGSGRATGFMDGATSGKVAASTSAITSDEIIDLIYSIDKSYRRSPNARLVLHDSTVAALRKIKVGSDDNRPVWQPSMREGAPDLIHGIPYFVNNAMAELSDGANAKVMAFGDFNQFNVRLIGGLEVLRLNERYADERSVGFFGYQRLDSKLMNTAAVKFLALAAS